MQKAAEEWPSLTRVRSSSSRDRKKVTCETLSKVDWYSRRPYEAQHYYYSDDEIDYKKGDPATEAEEDAAEEEDEGPEDELENPGHGDGMGLSSPRLDQLLASMPAKMVYGKPAVAIASPVREGKRLEKPLRNYPNPIPHSGTIKLHVNMHMSSHSAALNNNKVPATIKASSIIPPNITGKPKPPGLNNADEPSSPEVTCLGRVRIKHRYCKGIGKLGAAAGAVDDDKKKEAVAVDNDKKKQPAVGHESRTMKLRRGKKKKAGAAERESASAQRGKMGLGKAMEVQHPAGSGGITAEKGWEPVREGKYSSAETVVELRERGSRGEATMAYDSTAKGRKERWSSRDATEHEERAKFYQGKQEWRSRETSEAGDVSLQANFTIDLSRFSTAESQRGQGTILAKSLENLVGDGGWHQGYEQEIDTEFVPQVPPQNSLLLMRNSRNRENSATSSSSSSLWRGHGMSQEHVMDRTMDSRVSLLYSRQENPKRISSSLLEVRMEKPATTVSMAEKQQQISRLLELKMEEPSSAASMVEKLQQITLLQVKKNAMAHRQASLPKPPPEASIWQRRAIAKPSTLDIRNPIKQAIHQPTTR